MAFQFDNKAASSTTAKTNNTSNRYSFLGYINFDLGRSKLESVGLMQGNPRHVELFKALMTDRKGAILSNILKNVSLEFNPLGTGPDLSFLQGMDDFQAAAPVKTDKEKEIGYINVSLPDDQGELHELGGLKLFASNKTHEQLFHAFSQSDVVRDANLAGVKKHLNASFYPTALGNVVINGASAAVTTVSSFAALKAA